MKHFSTYALMLFTSLGLTACDSSDIDPTVDLPQYKNINFQVFHFANLNDQNSQFDDAIKVTASYRDPEVGLTETSLIEGNVFGATSFSSFLFPDSQNKSQFEVAVTLRDGNSQELLAENTKNLFLQPDQWVFAQGPYADNSYKLNQIDRPDIPENTDDTITIMVMNLTSFVEPQLVDVYLNGTGVQSGLEPETLSYFIRLNPNANYRLELKKSGSVLDQIAACTITAENEDVLVVFTPDLKCRLMAILDPQI